MEDDEFTAFVAQFSPRLLWTASLLLSGDRAGAEDLVQDALLVTFRKWSRIKNPEARLAYTRKTMTRMAARRGRSGSRVLELTSGAQQDSQQSNHEDESLSALDVRAALADLSPRQRAVMVLRYFEDLDEAQIAGVLGCSRGSVKAHASRAMRRLSASFADDGVAHVSARPQRGAKEQR